MSLTTDHSVFVLCQSSDYRNPYIYCSYKIFFFVKNIKKKRKYKKKRCAVGSPARTASL